MLLCHRGVSVGWELHPFIPKKILKALLVACTCNHSFYASISVPVDHIIHLTKKYTLVSKRAGRIACNRCPRGVCARASRACSVPRRRLVVGEELSRRVPKAEKAIHTHCLRLTICLSKRGTTVATRQEQSGALEKRVYVPAYTPSYTRLPSRRGS